MSFYKLFTLNVLLSFSFIIGIQIWSDRDNGVSESNLLLGGWKIVLRRIG